jgi:hypothetical protein
MTPEDLTTETTVQIGSYARRGQDGRTYGNGPGVVTPAYPSPSWSFPPRIRDGVAAE